MVAASMLSANKGDVRLLSTELETTAERPDRAIIARVLYVISSEKALGGAVLECDETMALSVVVASSEASLIALRKSLETALTEQHVDSKENKKPPMMIVESFAI